MCSRQGIVGVFLPLGSKACKQVSFRREGEVEGLLFCLWKLEPWADVFKLPVSEASVRGARGVTEKLEVVVLEPRLAATSQFCFPAVPLSES